MRNHQNPVRDPQPVVRKGGKNALLTVMVLGVAALCIALRVYSHWSGNAKSIAGGAGEQSHHRTWRILAEEFRHAGAHAGAIRAPCACERRRAATARGAERVLRVKR